LSIMTYLFQIQSYFLNIVKDNDLSLIEVHSSDTALFDPNGVDDQVVYNKEHKNSLVDIKPNEFFGEVENVEFSLSRLKSKNWKTRRNVLQSNSSVSPSSPKDLPISAMKGSALSSVPLLKNNNEQSHSDVVNSKASEYKSVFRQDLSEEDVNEMDGKISKYREKARELLKKTATSLSPSPTEEIAPETIPSIGEQQASSSQLEPIVRESPNKDVEELTDELNNIAKQSPVIPTSSTFERISALSLTDLEKSSSPPVVKPPPKGNARIMLPKFRKLTSLVTTAKEKETLSQEKSPSVDATSSSPGPFSPQSNGVSGKINSPSSPPAAWSNVLLSPSSSPSYVKKELEELEKEQGQVDAEAALLEPKIRMVMADGGSKNHEEIYLKRWFHLVNRKNALIRRQMQLNLMEKEMDLQRRYALLNEELRTLMVVEDWQKTPSQKEREALLLQELVQIVDKRNELVQNQLSQEKALEDDEMLENQLKSDITLTGSGMESKENCVIQ